MTDIIRLRPHHDPPAVEVAAIIAYGDEAPRSLRRLAHQLRLASQWLEMQNCQRRALGRRMEKLALLDADS